MLQRDGVAMMVMKVLVMMMMMMMMMMMIPMKPSSMTVTMATISPPPGRNFLDRFLPAGELSLCVCFPPPQRRQSLSAMLPPVLGFQGDDIRKGTLAEVGQGGHTTWRCGLGLARANGWCGPLVAHLALSFWLLQSSGQIGTSGYFPRIADLQKYGVLTVLFQQNPDSDSEFSNTSFGCLELSLEIGIPEFRSEFHRLEWYGNWVQNWATIPCGAPEFHR
jgi:hypothetical protein